MKKNNLGVKISLSILFLICWAAVYRFLPLMSDWVTFNLLHLSPDEQIAEAVRFFVFEYPKVMMLLVLIIFLVGIIRSYFTAERTRKALEGKRTFTGNIMASLLGIVTPFCSCSAIPLFLGFIESGVPLGITFSFLISAPMINEVAVILLYSMFGLKTALIYVFTGLFVAIISGWIIGKLNPVNWVEEWVFAVQLGETQDVEGTFSFADRIDMGVLAVKDIIKKVWLYVALGIAIGAGAHGYVPAEFMVSFMGKNVWYAVPLSVLIGIPLYSSAAGIVPVVSVLIEKGAALGTSLAFMMSVIALSLPEMIILRKVLKLKMIVLFATIVGMGIMVVGFLFNFLF